MTDTSILRGMATINYFADDMLAARKWYSELLGISPYFQRPDDQNPAYIEFRLGDYQHWGSSTAVMLTKGQQPVLGERFCSGMWMISRLLWQNSRRWVPQSTIR
jgi:hypothetical protein